MMPAMTQPYRMYGAEVSYFTAKARPALRAKRIFFEEMLATPAAYAEVILPRVGMGFIPVVITPNDETWQDTSEILDHLERVHPQIPLYPTTALQRITAYLYELYCDEFMILPALHYRWSYPESEKQARADFAAFNGVREMTDRFADNIKGFALGPSGINETTRPAIEAHTIELLDALEAHFTALPFLLGQRPSLADCSLMGPLYAHLYLDAVPGRLLRERAPLTCHWMQRMNHPDVPSFGHWLPDDALAPTFRRLLELVGRDAARLILDNAHAFEAWADENAAPGLEPPRMTGKHKTQLRGIGVERMTSAYTLWMLQRPLDALASLTASERARVMGSLAGSGCEPLLEYKPRHRLGKKRFKLVFENPGR
jgi:glutathione S-transferase